MDRPDSLISELHQEIVNSRGARKIPRNQRDEWSQQVYLELLQLWEEFSQKGGHSADFPGYVEGHLPKRLRDWWKQERAWGQVVLIPDYDPDDFVAEESTKLDLEGLSETEKRVWCLLVEGYRPQDIAIKIGKSYAMVRKILSKVYEKQRTARRVTEDGD